MTGRAWLTASLIGSLVLGLTSLPVHAGEPGETVLVNISSTGAQGGGWSEMVAISADGRFVTYDSDAANLVPGDTNGISDVFVYDRQTGLTERVSVSSSGQQGNGHSVASSISGDGRFVAFQSWASNLVSGNTNEVPDAFVHDRTTGQTVRVSVSSDGDQGTTGPYYGAGANPIISSDGRWIAFESSSANLVPDDTNGRPDVFVHDRLTGRTERVSVSNTGAEGDYGGGEPYISADGRYQVFTSASTNLVEGDTNGVADIFVRDRVTGTTERVSVKTGGQEAMGTELHDWTRWGSISADGRYVAFSSNRGSLVPDDTNSKDDVFIFDRVTGEIVRVSVSASGDEGNGDSYLPALSADGRYVAFNSYASNLVPGDDWWGDVFVHDRLTGELWKVTIGHRGVELGAGESYTWTQGISADGGVVAFTSQRQDLVYNDAFADHYDVFVHDWRTPLCGGLLSPPYSGAVVPTPGSTAGPGGTLSLTVTDPSATGWEGPEWRVAGTGAWQSQGSSGTVLPGQPFTVGWSVPLDPNVYEIRLKLTDSGGSRYTEPLVLTLPAQPQPVATPGSEGDVELVWNRGGATRYVVERSADAAFPSGQTERLTAGTGDVGWRAVFNGVAFGSFEQESSGGGAPSGWSVTGTAAVDPAVACWGNRSLQLAPAPLGDAVATQEVFAGPGLSGQPVAASAWLKAEEVTGGGAVLRLRFFSRQGAPLGDAFSSALLGTADWQQVTAVGWAPEGTWSVVLSVGLEQAGGRLWVDGVQVEPTDRPLRRFSPGNRPGVLHYYRVVAWNGPLYNTGAPVAAVAPAGFPDHLGSWSGQQPD